MEKLYTSIKSGVAILTASAAVTIIVSGALFGSILIPLCGGVCLLPVGLIIFENTKTLRDMRKIVKQLKNELKEFEDKLIMLNETNNKLKYNVSELTLIKDNFKNEVSKLSILLKEGEKDIDMLNNMVHDYNDTNQKLKNSINSLQTDNKELTKNIEDLLDIKFKYEVQINELTLVVKDINSKLESMENIKNDYEIQLNTLKHENMELIDTSNSLKEDLTKVQNMYQKSKDVISTLIKTKDIFEDLYSDMAKTASDMSNTEHNTELNVEQMKDMIKKFDEKRTQEIFDKLDVNKDGTISMDEFLNN